MTSRKLFREYIGANWTGVQFDDVQINDKVDFHFILAYAADYNNDLNNTPVPLNGKFNIFWADNLTGPDAQNKIRDFKLSNPNVKFALSIGGDNVNGQNVQFKPSNRETWVTHAVSSLTDIIKEYNLDGIDIAYEHFQPNDQPAFAYCMGKLIKTLRDSRIIKFASIAPGPHEPAMSRYKALFASHARYIDYVNYKSYDTTNVKTVDEFVKHFNEQRDDNYPGANMLASFSTSPGAGGLNYGPNFINACHRLHGLGVLGGVCVWCADDATGNEVPTQNFLAGLRP